MSDCNHEHIICVKCRRDITGGDAHLNPVTSTEVAPAIKRIRLLEGLLANAKEEIRLLKLAQAGITPRKGLGRGHYTVKENRNVNGSV